MEEGIFRLAPDATECDTLRHALNSDADALSRIDEHTDPHVLANLIKLWFRLLPTKLLAGEMATAFAASASGAEAMALLQSFPPLHQGIFLWLLELMADVAEQQEANRMNERAIAIVMAPNLYGDDAQPSAADGTAGAAEPIDPMAALEHSQKMARLITELLLHYINVRVRVRSTSASPATSVSLQSGRVGMILGEAAEGMAATVQATEAAEAAGAVGAVAG
uniref:Rho-GAP domain-containing protein n=1 Tax=Haptolina brevifila TaxID=156173 RepID=A0A7S2HD61_9EUKA|mmetsp:Transcript_53453/g.106325  ORF Transcript_53453/g.106325 Transcript_53453/m.106325 type:complete len:222 (+) Transcript_53453:30-695(+)